MPSKGKAPATWHKVLYKKQHYPDNHVDPSSFLSALKRSPSAPRLDLSLCLVVAGRLVQELSLCCLCACLFAWLDRMDDNQPLLLPITLTLSLALLLTFAGLLFWKNPKNAGQVSGNCCVFLLYGYGFSPVLKDLTSTVSTDTVYAMVSMAFLLHLFVQDYGAQAPIVSTTLAFNASLFAAVCLASRLKSIVQAFTLLTFCAGVFAWSPLMHGLSACSPKPFQASLTLVLSTGALGCLALLSWPLCNLLLLAALMFFLGVVCPCVFYRFQMFKENIFGPWDEAVVHCTPSSVQGAL